MVKPQIIKINHHSYINGVIKQNPCMKIEEIIGIADSNFQLTVNERWPLKYLKLHNLEIHLGGI